MRSRGDWTPTGATRIRVGWFGLVYAEREWSRSVFWPVSKCHTPANWRTETRWRPRVSGLILEEQGGPPAPTRKPPSSADE